MTPRLLLSHKLFARFPPFRLFTFLTPLALLLFSCSSPQSHTEYVLGTLCSLTLYENHKKEIFEKVFTRVREIDALMSRTLPESDIYKINSLSGEAPAPVHEETFRLVEAGIEFSRLSNGAFNIAVGPLVTLWSIGTQAAAVPPKDALPAALALTSYEDIILDKKSLTVFLKKKGMALDLGAIAKGYAADEAARILRDNANPRAIIDFGGNILVTGTRPDGKKWQVGVQAPGANRGEYIGIIEAQDTSVVSSGVYERFFVSEDGLKYHHILDTRTGAPVDNGLLSVTVIAHSSQKADALSTLLFALGLPEALRLAENTPGVEALFVTDGKKLHATRGLKKIFRLTNTQYSF
ncbi:MAG: FAD:protein FMN transferase [Spirochaetales bacterium]|jgi:thiamine biosynthesis lipoprotein|nr:FAD:protein FMN transferase [Spirochaetales bacterium]